MHHQLVALIVAVLACACGAETPTPPDVEEVPPPTFAADVHPLFVARCGSCHASDLGVSPLVGPGFFGDAQVDVAYDAAVASISPGSPDASTLYVRLSTDDETLRMPATGEGGLVVPAFTNEELTLVREWIEGGSIKE